MLKQFIYISFVSLLLLSSFASTAQKSKLKLVNDERSLEVSRLFTDACKDNLVGSAASAEAQFKKCIAIDDKHAPSYYELSKLYYQMGDFKQALSNAIKATELDPSNRWYQLQLAEVYRRSGKYKEAIKTYNLLIDLESHNIELYLELASTYAYDKQTDKVLETFERIEQKNGFNLDISLQKIDYYRKLQQWQKAIDELKRIIEKYPSEVSYLHLIADFYTSTKDVKNELLTYTKILQIDPTDGTVHLSLANYYQSINKIDSAYYHLALAFKNPMTDVDTKIGILYSYYSMIAYRPEIKAKAMELAKLTIEVHPTEAKAHTMYADLLIQDKQFEQARNSLKTVIQLDDSKYQVWQQLLYCELQLNQFDSLIVESTQAIELFPEQAIFYLYKGMAQYKKGAYTLSAETLQKGLNMAGSEPTIISSMYAELGNSFYETKQYELSDKAFNKALEADPKNAYVLNNYSYYLSERGEKLDTALIMSEQANKLNPNDPAYIDTYGWILYKQKKYIEAEVELAKAIKLLTTVEGTILEHYGDVLYQLNKLDQALNLWIEAKKAGGASKWIDKKIEDKKLYE